MRSAACLYAAPTSELDNDNLLLCKHREREQIRQVQASQLQQQAHQCAQLRACMQLRCQRCCCWYSKHKLGLRRRMIVMLDDGPRLLMCSSKANLPQRAVICTCAMHHSHCPMHSCLTAKLPTAASQASKDASVLLTFVKRSLCYLARHATSMSWF